MGWLLSLLDLILFALIALLPAGLLALCAHLVGLEGLAWVIGGVFLLLVVSWWASTVALERVKLRWPFLDDLSRLAVEDEELALKISSSISDLVRRMEDAALLARHGDAEPWRHIADEPNDVHRV